MTVRLPVGPTALLLAALVVLASGGCRRGASQHARAASGTDAPTFARDIAPLVHERCAPCHHEGGPGPFSLLTFDDVKRRARQIVSVTRSRFMPPWLPVPGHGEFAGERRLTDAQIALIARWVDRGAPEGSSGDRSALPVFPTEWQLGTPDAMITPPEAFVLRAGGGDVFHNFVLRAPVSGPRFVRALEILPGNKRVVHHANIVVDRSGAGRARDAEDPGVGFAGMDIEIASSTFEPDSHFLFWKPGTPVVPEPADMAWRIDADTDLILNMHLQPSGKPEPIRPTIGLYFTDRAPSRFPMLLQLEHDGDIDIPPGAASFTVTDELEMPVPVQVLGVYPHAHYLGREIQGLARLPDGTTRWLIHIAAWDLNWQAVYQLARPMALPAGTVLSMRWTYDNSDRNARNPNTPPVRVVAGNRSEDEMAHLWVQVLPERREDLPRLQEALMRGRLRKYPGDFLAHTNLGAILQSDGRLEEAIAHLREAVRRRPDHAPARNNLGTALLAAGRLDEAVTELRDAARRDPRYAAARYNLANALLAQGKPADAIPLFRHIVETAPDDAAAWNDLGAAQTMLGRLDEAAASLTRSLRLEPANGKAHYNLGLIAATRGRLREAVPHFERAVQLDPDDREAADALARARAELGHAARARR